MIKKQTTWEEILQKFDLFEQHLGSDIYDKELDVFFIDLKEYFTNKEFEQWQIAKAQERIQDIIHKIKQLTQEAQDKSIELAHKQKQFNSYIKTEYLGNKH